MGVQIVFKSALARAWPWLRGPLWLGVGLLLGFGTPYVLYLDGIVRERFSALEFAQPSRVFARPLALEINAPLDRAMLEVELGAARYRISEEPLLKPGTYRIDDARIDIATRDFVAAQGPVAAQRLSVTLRDGRIAAILDSDSGIPIERALVDPARIATLYGPKQEERRFVRAAEVPPLLIATLQAVEDRDFKTHVGIDPSAILRAAFANLFAGEVVQGGSTLTQQLVRNLFLDRSQTVTRKVNEALIAILIEARFDKTRILEAYLNEVYLGQLGGQAVHGVAAAAEFYFGRDLNALDPADIALLVGLIRGPSLYDPRRFPERALARRRLVIGVMAETGLLSAGDQAVELARPLAVVAAGALPRNRYPAFLELVRREIAATFPDAALEREGLSVLTTLAPSAQLAAERAIAKELDALGERGKPLEAAMVVTETATGAIAAIVGARAPGAQGFNRALDARRPIGSLVKPFVYLVALAQPDQWSLATQLSDRRVSLRQPNGQIWAPENADGNEHGEVALIDALARSYNLATVRLGLDIDVRKVARVLEALIPGVSVEPLPSLLLGAVDLSPYQMAQAYQYLAADGRAQALFAVAAVLDADGNPLARTDVIPAPGDLVAPARLVTYALKQAAISGTARALASGATARFGIAGKTGTSNDQRDSWFAGYTGDRMAVVWVGRDDNRETGLFGATGAMKVWANAIGALPTRPLRVSFDDNPRMVWTEASALARTEPNCPGARQVPFVTGFEPSTYVPCGGDRLGDFLRDTGLLPERDAPPPAPAAGWRYLGDPNTTPSEGPRGPPS